MTAHAFWRALVLVLLGVFLRSVGRDRTNFTFEDTLSQIGLGYGVPVPARRSGRRATSGSPSRLILVGYWAAFAALSAAGPGVRLPPQVGVPATGRTTPTGFAAHWNKNATSAWAFDTWFLNLFPREKPFRYNGGGYATLSFIPTLGTMILGLIAGGVLRSDRPAVGEGRLAGRRGRRRRWRRLGLGATGDLPGRQADLDAELGPLQRRLVLPAPGGLLRRHRRASGSRGWAFPLVVIGMNSIAAYCLSHLIEGFIARHASRPTSAATSSSVLGPAYAAARSRARPCCWCSG